MAKNYSQRKITRKSVIAALCALSVTCTGLAAACTPNNNEDDPDPVAREDTQLLKNGNFEFFNVPKKGVYLINNVNDWTLGGDSSVKSGIIGTSDAAWEKLTDAKRAASFRGSGPVAVRAQPFRKNSPPWCGWSGSPCGWHRPPGGWRSWGR